MGKKWLSVCMTILFTFMVTFIISIPLPALEHLEHQGSREQQEKQEQENKVNQENPAPQQNQPDTDSQTPPKKKSRKERREEKKKEEEEKKRKQIEWWESLTLEQLMNLEITAAAKKSEKVLDVPASVAIISRAEIQTYGYQTLAEVLESIPGLYFTDDYSTNNFGVRGFWTSDPLRNMIVLVNGIQQTEYMLSTNPLELNNIPVEAIDRVEVVRGPMSVLYGSGAFFGAINIITNKVIEYQPVSLASFSIGSDKTYQVTVRSSGKYKGLEYAFNGSYYDTYGLNVPYSKLVREPALLPGFGVPMDASTGGQLENREKYFNFSGLFRGFYFDAQYSQSEKEAAIVLPSVSEGTSIVFRALRLQVGYEKKFSPKIRVKGMLNYFYNRWNFDFDHLFENFYGTQTNGSSGYKADITGFYDPSPGLNITLGLSYNKVTDIISEYTAPAFGLYLVHNKLADGESLVHQALFTQVSYKISKRFNIVAGLRLEQTPDYTLEQRKGNPNFFDYTDPNWGKYTTDLSTYSYSKIQFIPRLALIWTFKENNYLKFLYGKAINNPSFFQNSQRYNIPAGIPDLQPEIIQTLELNYIGGLDRRAKKTMGMSLFHNKLDKLIYRTFFPIGPEYTSYFGNVGKMTTTGVEWTLLLRPTKRWNLEFNATYQHTTDKRPGITQNLDAAYSPKFLAGFKVSKFFNDEISLAVTGNYVDRMQPYYDHTMAAPGRIGDPVKGYFLLGANFRIRDIKMTGWYINLRGSNLLDQEIRYPATSNNVNFAQKGTIGRGISFLLTVGYSFLGF